MEQRVCDYGLEKNNFQKYRDVKSVLKYGMDAGRHPDLSIVIPTYHREAFLKEAIDSAVQDFAGLTVEIVIVENDSYEFPGSSMHHMLKAYDATVVHYYQNERNIGMFGNWNRCFELARAPWVAMLHDDDLLATDYYAKAKRLLQKAKKDRKLVFIKSNEAPIRNGEVYRRNGTKEYFVKKLENRILRFGRVGIDLIGPDKIGLFGACSCGSLMKRDVYIACGGFDEDHYPSADAQYPVRIVAQGFRIAQAMGVLGHYRWGENASYKERVIIGFMEEQEAYIKYYAAKNARTRFLYRVFSAEMYENYRGFLFSCIDDSKTIENKEALRNEVDRRFPAKNRRIRMKIYRLGYALLWRTKQIAACFR